MAAKRTRVQRVARILTAETPYRVNLRQVRAVLNVLPNPRASMRPAIERLAAAVVALPHRITASHGR